MISNIDPTDFNKEVLQSKRPILIDFWAPDCKACRALKPDLEALDKELSSKVTFGSFDVSKDMNIANRYGVMSLPTLLLFQSGKCTLSIVGKCPKEKLKRKLEEVL